MNREYKEVNLNNYIKFKPTLKGIKHLNDSSEEIRNRFNFKSGSIDWLDKLEDGYLEMQIHQFLAEFSDIPTFNLPDYLNINVMIQVK